MKSAPDPAELAIFNALFAAVAEEMGLTLGRIAHSPNIKERREYSRAVFDPRGRLVAQAGGLTIPAFGRKGKPGDRPADQSQLAVEEGDRLTLETPGGGGWLAPSLGQLDGCMPNAATFFHQVSTAVHPAVM